MKRLRPYQQQVASLLKAFSPYLGAILLLAGLAAAFVAYNTHEQQPPTAVEGSANSQAPFVEEAFPADNPPGTPSSITTTTTPSEGSQAAAQQRGVDRPAAKVPKPAPERSESISPVPQTLLSGRASVSSFTFYSVAELLQQYVRNPQSAAGAKAKNASFGQRLGADALSKLAFATHEPGGGFVEALGPLNPPPMAPMTTETLPAGTWIIAMDEALQGGSNNRVREAYGLAVHLLHDDVPLKWIIDPNKTSRTAVDFSASARERFPNTGSYANRNFRTGPIAIFPGYEAQAQPIINSFGNGIRVYELQNATTVPVNSDLTHKPFVFVEQQENPDIHTGILSSAGLVENTHYEEGDLTTVTASSCVTIITVPHNDDISSTQRQAVKDFTRGGGNFFAQCAGVRGFQDNTPRVFTNAGFVDEPGLGSFQYDNPQEPSAQFEGNVPDEGGSLENFAFQTDPPGGTRIVHDSGNDFKAYTGRIDGFTASAGGYVHYLGGHDYDGDIDADRYYLNAVLRSAERPSVCGLEIDLVNANDDTGTIDCGNASVTIDVLANDDNPQGNPLTVNLLGSGSNGTFVNNNDGTVTYTGNVNGFWGGDSVDYEACDGSTCDQATITITSTNPNQLTINGTVFEDIDTDAMFDAGESGPSGITVQLYEDANGNGMRDAGESLEQSTTTSTGGDYQFVVSSTPTSTTNTTLNTTKATSNYEDSDDGYGDCPDLYIEDDPNYRSHVFIEFDLSSLDPTCTVSSATLTLTKSDYGGGGGNFDFAARRVTQPWTEGSNSCSGGSSGLSWTQRTSSANWSTAGGSFSSTAYDTATGSDNDPTGTQYTLDITALVNEWLNGTHPNYGVGIVPISNGSTYDWFAFDSDDASNSSDRPKLDVTLSCGSPVDYVIEVDAATLPSGATFTTDNIETANFTALGQLDCNNNFGFDSNGIPTANDDAATVCEGVTQSIAVTSNDDFGSDGPGSSPITIVSNASNGSASVNTNGTANDPTDDLISYVSNIGFSGTDQVTYQICDSNGDCDQATLTITVQDRLSAGSNGSLTICEGETVTTAQLFNALGGSPDPGGTWSPTLAGAGTYTYTHAASGVCPSSSAEVVVTEEPAQNAGTNGTLTICEGETVTTTQLFNALGGNPDSGGTWSPTPAGAGTYTYTLSATANCPAASAQVVVSEEPAQNAGTNGTLTICEGETVTTTELFNALGGNPDSGGTWSPTLAGAGTYTYTLPATANCPAVSAQVVVTEEPALDAGSNGTLTICEGDMVTTTQLFNALGGNPDTGGTWSPTPAGAGTYTYTHAATANCPATSAEVVVTEEAALDPGSNGTLTICEGETVTTTQLFNALNGNPDPGGTWSPTPAGAGTYTYTHFGSASCPTTSAQVVVTEEPAADPGTNGTLTICEGETVTTTQLFNALGGTPDTGGSWSPTPAGAGTYTYTLPATANCPAVTAQVVVTEEPAQNAGTNGTLTICEGETVTTTELFNALGGNPDSGGTWSPTPAGAGTYTYTLSATANCPAVSAQVVVTEEPALDAGSNGTLTICEGDMVTTTQLFNALGGNPDTGGTWSPTPAGAGTYTYTHAATANCPATSAEVVVTEEAALDPGSNGTLTICEGETVTTTQLFNALNGNPDPGGTWSPTPAGAGTYTYTLAATANCPAVSSQVVVTEEPALDPGSDGTLTICEGDTDPVDLFSVITGEDAGGTWTETSSTSSGVSVGSGTSVNFSLVAPGVYEFTYTHAATANCPATSSTATITVEDQLSAGTGGSDEFCEGSGASYDLTALLSGADPGGNWVQTSGISFINLSDPSNVNFSMAVFDTYTFTYTHPASGACSQDQATVTINITEQLDAGADNSDALCEGDGADYNLEALLSNDADAGGNWLQTSGASFISLADPASVDFSNASPSVYTFTYTHDVVGSCLADQATITVTVEERLEAGTNGTLNICEGETVTESALFASLGGSPDPGGVWTPTLAGAGTYTYTHAATANCPASTAQVVVTETTGLDAGENGTLEICAGETVTETQLFNALGGMPDAGGNWSPAFAGAGTYTYTHPAVGACPSSSAQVVVTETPNPNAGLAVSGDVICEGETGTITVNASQNGVSYQLRLESNDSNVGSPVAGNGGAISFSVTPNTTTIYNILATNSTTNCAAELQDKPTVTVNPLPSDALTVSDDAICEGETGQITISNSESGVLYQLRDDANDNAVGSALIGNGGDLTFNVSPATTTTYNVLAVITATNCSVELTDKATVTVNPNPDAGLTVSDDAICAGETATITVSGSQAGVSYQLRLESNDTNVGTPVSGNGGAISFSVTPSMTTTYNVFATNSTTSCFAELTDQPTVTVEDPLDAGTNGTLNICAGETVTESALFASLGGSPDPGGVWTPTLAGAGTYTYTHAATANCPASTAQVVVTETTGLDAGENGTLEICAGETVTETQLFNALGGMPDAGGNWSPAFAGAGTYTYTHPAVGACPSSSAQVVVTETPNPNAGLAVSGDVICEGETGTITVNASQNGVSYQLRLESNDSNVGSPVAGNGGAISFSVMPSSTTQYNILATNSTTDCAVELTNKPTVTVNPIPSEVLSVSDDVICEGETAQITISNSESGVLYQLRDDANDNAVGSALIGNGGDITFNLMPSSTTTYNVLAIITANNCSVELTDKPTVTVNPNPDAGLTVSDDVICLGETATITISGSQAGVSYQLRLESNDNNVGAPVVGNGGAVSFSVTPSTTTTYNVFATNSTTSCTAELTDKPTVTVNPNPSNALAVSDDVICEGEMGTITVSGTEIGVSYQLRLESDDSNVGSSIAGNGGAINFNVMPSSTTQYNILATIGTTGCAVELANKPTVTVNPIPNQALSVSDDVICAGETAQITISNSEAGVLYQLRDDADDTAVGSVLIGNGGSITFNLTPSTTTTYNVLATISANNCSVELTDKPTVTVEDPLDAGENGTLNICAGETVTEAALFAALGGTPDPGGVWTPALAGAGTYTYTHAATANCSATSAQVVVSETAGLDAGENGTLTICEGETVTEMQLFNALSGTPDPGGVWTPALAGAGTYTYTHAAVGACPESSAQVVVTEEVCCPDAPILSIGEVACVNGSTYEYTFTASPGATVTSTNGTVNGNTVTVAVGTNDILTAISQAGCDEVTLSVASPASCNIACEQPDLTLGNGVCNGATYSVAFTETTGATVTTAPGSYTISGGVISGIPVGTDLQVTATNPSDGACAATLTATSPDDCGDPCVEELISVSGLGECAPDGSTYSVNFSLSAGATLNVSPAVGTVGANSITGIPAGTSITLTATNGVAPCDQTDEITVAAPDCCPDAPIASVGQVACVNGSTYEYTFAASPGATAISASGTVSGNTVTVAVGTDDVLTVYNDANCETVVLNVSSPATCNIACEQPDLTTANGVCDGTTYSVAFTETTGATVTTAPGSYTISGGVISGIPVGTDLQVTATNPSDGACAVTLTVESPDDCDVNCPDELVSVSALGVCSPDLSTYSVNFTLAPGATLTTDPVVGTIGANTVTGIPAGTSITLIATNAACNLTDEIIVAAPNCGCPAIDPPVSGGDQSYCAGDPVPTISASVPSGQTVDWYDAPTGGTLLASGTTSFVPPMAGTYYAEAVETASGCTSSTRTAITVSEIPEPTIDVTPTNPTDCEISDGRIVITATGASNLKYSIDGGLSFSDNGTFIGLDPGAYDVVVMYGDDCMEDFGTVTLAGPSNPTVTNVSVNNPDDCDSPTGSITVTTDTDVLNTEYSIDGGQTWQASNIFNGLIAGFYEVYVRNSDGTCPAVGPVVALNEPIDPILLFVTTTDPTGCNGTNGTITAFGGGGEPPYQFRLTGPNGLVLGWTLPGTQFTFTGLAPGDYDVSIRNSDGTCEIEPLTVRLDGTTEPTIVGLRTERAECLSGGSATLFVDGGEVLDSYQYSTDGLNWTPGGSSFTFSDLGGGMKTLFVANADLSCPVTIDVMIDNACLELEKTSVLTDTNSDGFIGVGDVINFSFVVTNTGTLPITSVNITDPQLPILSSFAGTLNPGDSYAGASAQYTVTLADVTAGQYVNQAEASGQDPENMEVTDLSDDPDDPTDNDLEGDGEPDDPTVTIIPDAQPTANDDNVSVCEGSSINADVLANDDFGGNGPSTGAVAITSNASNGVATVDNNGTANDPTDDSIDYTPNVGFTGMDMLSYEICDADGDCSTATLTITVENQLSAGTNGTLNICEGETVTEAALFAALGGTPDPGGVWTPALAGAGTYTYTHAATANCSATSAQVVVSETAGLDAGENGTLTICEGETVTEMQLFNALSGTPDPGGVWTPALAGAGTYTYTHAAVGACPESSAQVVVTEEVCCPDAPILSIGEVACVNGSTYEYTFTASPGATVTSTNGTVNGNTVTVAVGTNDILTAISQAGCDEVTLSVASPASCNIACEQPDLTLGNGVCNGATYSVAFTETTGATVTTAPGSYTISGGVISGIPVGTDLQVTATNPSDGACAATLTATSPDDCGDPCVEELISVSGLGECAPDGSTYSVNFSLSAGATLNVSPAVGTVGANSITGIPAGTSITLTATNGVAPCDQTDEITVAAPDCCPDAPIASVGQVACVNGSTYEYTFAASPGATAISASGTVSGNTVTVAVGTDDVLTVYNDANCETVVLNVSSPATCNIACEQPDLTTANGVCDGTTYSVAFTETTGATVTTAPGSYTISGGVISGIPVGTDLQVTATNPSDGACAVTLTVESPDDCDVNCPDELVSVSALGVCSPDLSTYSVNFTLAPGATLTTDPVVGTIGANTVTGIPAGTSITLIATNAACNLTDEIIVAAPNCGCPAIDPPVSGGDQSYCAGDPVPTISASVPSGQTVDWYDAPTGGTLLASGTTSFVPPMAGTYYAEAVETASGCTSSLRTAVTVTEVSLTVSNVTADDPTCPSKDDGSIVITATTSGTQTVLYSIDNGATFQPSNTFSGLMGGTYNVVVQLDDPLSCQTSALQVVLNTPDCVPTANDDLVNTDADTPVNIDVLVNDDFGGDGASTGTITIITPPMDGTATVNDGGTPNDPTDDTIDYTPDTGFSGPDNLFYEICDADGDCDDAEVIISVDPAPFVKIQPVVMLQGALLGSPDNLMRDDLRSSNLIPSVEPYTALANFNHTGGGGNETIANTSTVLADNGPNSIVDWVYVELRDANDPTLVLATRAGLVQRDGDVVEMDGTGPLCFTQNSAGNYYVAVRHRNHLGTMTASSIALDDSGIVVDFSSPSLDVFNTAPVHDGRERADINGVKALWAGNTNVDDKVVYAGQDNDKDPIFNDIDQAPGNIFNLQTYILSGYLDTDVNMDGESIYAGQDNDVDPIFNNVDGYPANIFKLQTYVIPEQLAK